MKITVEVTAEDIKKGIRRNCMKCPIARAIRRVMPRERIVVSNYFVQVGKGDSAKLVHLHSSAREFMGWFDSGLQPDPLTFELDDTVIVP